ncbi:hypothetical protein BSLG_000991 [Batrachochytrium salamandrivorans]|nr:hypothetical protein BSLG_000991 [Batrachochytrium salamandrivorans]
MLSGDSRQSEYHHHCHRTVLSVYLNSLFVKHTPADIVAANPDLLNPLTEFCLGRFFCFSHFFFCLSVIIADMSSIDYPTPNASAHSLGDDALLIPDGSPSCIAAVHASMLGADSSGSNVTLSGFEGPEKLLEIWFKQPHTHAHSAAIVPDYNDGIHGQILHPNNSSEDGDSSEGSISDCENPHRHYLFNAKENDHDQFSRSGLRVVRRDIWEDMLNIVQCKVLSVIKNKYADAYLLSESSMFVYKNRIVLKTCGTTTLLNAVTRILAIAKDICGFGEIQAVFYSRKAFLFLSARRGLMEDGVKNGMDMDGIPVSSLSDKPLSSDGEMVSEQGDEEAEEEENAEDDVTLEILMTHLDPEAMKMFWRNEEEINAGNSPDNKHAAKHRFKGAEDRSLPLLAFLIYIRALCKRAIGCVDLLNGAVQGFRRRDRIMHSLGQWDLVFCHFEKPALGAIGDQT